MSTPEWALELGARDPQHYGDWVDVSPIVAIPPVNALNTVRLLRMSWSTPRRFNVQFVSTLSPTTATLAVGMRRGVARYTISATAAFNPAGGTWSGAPQVQVFFGQWMELVVNPTPNAGANVCQAWGADEHGASEAVELRLMQLHKMLASGARIARY